MVALAEHELKRYAQQIKLSQIGEAGQVKLKQTRVLCVGLGGLGSPLLLYLAAAGVGTLGLVDEDAVELSNLHRQILYDTQQVGQSKTDAARSKLLALNPELNIQTHHTKLSLANAAELVAAYDLIADCTDNFYTRYLLHDVCFALKKPYVYASVSQFEGYCSIFHGSPCLRCIFPTPPEAHLIPNCDEGGVVGVLPGLLGMFQATEIIKWVLNLGKSLQSRLLRVDVLNMRFKEIELIKNPECDLCVKHLDFKHLTGGQTCDFTQYAISFETLSAFLHANKNVVLIDVRTEAEHRKQNSGGQCIPLALLPQKLHELDKDQTFVLYCQTGKRSLAALHLMREAGFKSVKYVV